MFGPQPKGAWTAKIAATPFKHLQVGGRYIVAEAFTDYDGDLHPPGESWTFLTQHFVPYHDGLSLFVSLDGEREWQIRLHWTPEGQGAVIDALESIVRPA